MAGLYIHIPFCRQACTYCNFHFVTSRRQENELVAALLNEMELQRNYLGGQPLETIYFGGGTPSLLPSEAISQLLEKASRLFGIEPGAEITLEANPDDISGEQLAGWKATGVNRLSIGIQSFFDADLQWMNRSHNAAQSAKSLELAAAFFSNITIDLIYGIPGMDEDRWHQNVKTAIRYGFPHFSCYALTVEPATPLKKMILQHLSAEPDPDAQSAQFLLLMSWMEAAGYEHYEISNFAKPGYASRHNAAYWSTAKGMEKTYLGIGPSAHSYDGISRQWNVANNSQYIESIRKGLLPFEKEILTADQKLNEYIMTALRTSKGIDLARLEKESAAALLDKSLRYREGGLMDRNDQFLALTRQGKLLADGIAADLFV